MPRPDMSHATTGSGALLLPPEAGWISLGETTRSAVHALWGNRLRSLLTALGVVIGVAAVVALLAIGRGTQQEIRERITANGAHLLTVRAAGAAGGAGATLTVADAEALADPRNVPDARAVAPETTGIASVVVGSQSKTTLVKGVTASYAAIHNSRVSEGAWLDAGQNHQPVAVLGARIAVELFGGASPVGQTLRIKGQRVRVIGVLAARGGGALSFDDDTVFVPLGLAQRKLFGERVAGAGGRLAVSAIVVQARDQASIERVRAAIAVLLRERHRLPPGGASDDFTIDNQQDLIDTLSETSRSMTVFLGAIAAISLVVGGIGIMNIMLVGVRERTREIGLRKALGARERDILRQFLIEALTLSLGGGLVGVLLGVAIALIADGTGRATASVAPASVALALGCALAIGLFFGIEPARRAARLHPIEALRSP